MKTGWIYFIIGMILLAAAVLLAFPLLDGPRSIRQVCSEARQIDTAECQLTEITDSLSSFTHLDSITFANLFEDSINK